MVTNLQICDVGRRSVTKANLQICKFNHVWEFGVCLATTCKTGKFSTWKFLASQTDNKWWLRQFFDSCDYLSQPLYNPDDQWWQHFDAHEDQWWRHFDGPNNWWRWHFDDPFYNSQQTCDYPEWCHWWPMWWHWWPLLHSLSPWLRPSDKKDDKVTTRTTNDPSWWCGKSSVTCDYSEWPWWPKWWPKYDPNHPDNNRWVPLMINVMTCWRPWKFLDKIWWLHLAIFIAKVKSCLSCWCEHVGPHGK